MVRDTRVTCTSQVLKLAMVKRHVGARDIFQPPFPTKVKSTHEMGTLFRAFLVDVLHGTSPAKANWGRGSGAISQLLSGAPQTHLESHVITPNSVRGAQRQLPVKKRKIHVAPKRGLEPRDFRRSCCEWCRSAESERSERWSCGKRSFPARPEPDVEIGGGRNLSGSIKVSGSLSSQHTKCNPLTIRG